MKKKLLLMVVALLGLGGAVHAQVYFQNTMYSYSQFAYNPAAAGVTFPGLRSGANLSLMGRLQWAGFSGAPETSVLSFHTPLRPGIGAAGVNVIVDRLGPMSNTYAQAAYAYEFGLLENKINLRIGVAAGIRQVGINFERIGGAITPNQGAGEDAAIPTTGLNTAVEALHAGIYVSALQDRLFVSVAGQNLTDPSIDAITGGVDLNNIQTSASRTLTAAAGYLIPLSDDKKVTVQPTVMMITDFALAPQFNASLLWGISPLVIGLNYRVNSGESIGGVLGVNINANTFLGYSYDFPLSDLNNNTDINTHEVILSYTFSNLFGSKKGDDEDDVIKRDDLLGKGTGL